MAKKTKPTKHWVYANPERIKGDQAIRRSSASGYHSTGTRKGTRASARRAAINEQLN